MPKFFPEEANAEFENFDETLPSRLKVIFEKYSKQDFIQELQTYALSKSPDEEYSYSNVDTELLAYVLEGVYQASFDKLLTKYFTASGMPSTKIKLI